MQINGFYTQLKNTGKREQTKSRKGTRNEKVKAKAEINAEENSNPVDLAERS